MNCDENPPELTLRQAIADLSGAGVTIRAVSRFYATPCFPAGAGPDYVNAAVLAEFDGTSYRLLDVLHGVEHRFGRERVQRWGMRTLDLDLLLLNDQVLPSRETFASWRGLPPEEQVRATPNEMILPHPRLQDRAFVLVPLADVAPDWRHPVLAKTVREMLAALPEADRRAVRPI